MRLRLQLELVQCLRVIVRPGFSEAGAIAAGIVVEAACHSGAHRRVLVSLSIVGSV